MLLLSLCLSLTIAEQSQLTTIARQFDTLSVTTVGTRSTRMDNALQSVIDLVFKAVDSNTMVHLSALTEDQVYANDVPVNLNPIQMIIFHGIVIRKIRNRSPDSEIVLELYALVVEVSNKKLANDNPSYQVLYNSLSQIVKNTKIAECGYLTKWKYAVVTKYLLSTNGRHTIDEINAKIAPYTIVENKCAETRDYKKEYFSLVFVIGEKLDRILPTFRMRHVVYYMTINFWNVYSRRGLFDEYKEQRVE